MTALSAGLVRLVGAEWQRTYAIAAGMAVLLCFTGANNSTVLPLLPRFAYWLILMIGGTLVAQTTGLWTDKHLRLNAWQEIAVMTSVITPPIVLIVWLVTAAFTWTTPNPRVLPYYVFPVMLISLCMAVLHTTVTGLPLQSHVHPGDADTKPAGETLRARLDFKYRQAAIFALSSEDHYLRVHTSAGEALVLMRLYDAIRELDGIEGSQIHRSWWVARDAVADIARGDGKVDLVLKSGLRAPVSRRYQKALKTDGWL